MSDHQMLELAVSYPKVVVGKPKLSNPEMTVEYVLELLALGITPAELRPCLTPEDIEACVLFANQANCWPEGIVVKNER